MLRAIWSDLNLPARINTLVAAGIPMIQKLNANHIMAMKNYVERYEMGIYYNTINELIPQLKDKELMERVEQEVKKNRMEFTFDYHVPSLINFFRDVISSFKHNL